MISRIEIPNGIEIVDLYDAPYALARIAIEHDIPPEVLTTGTYDVTPKIWTRHTHKHEVTVLDNGEGLYRMYPREDNVSITEYLGGEGLGTRSGGRVNPINADTPVAAVLGGHPFKKGLYVFGIFTFVEISL